MAPVDSGIVVSHSGTTYGGGRRVQNREERRDEAKRRYNRGDRERTPRGKDCNSGREKRVIRNGRPSGRSGLRCSALDSRQRKAAAAAAAVVIVVIVVVAAATVVSRSCANPVRGPRLVRARARVCSSRVLFSSLLSATAEQGGR